MFIVCTSCVCIDSCNVHIQHMYRCRNNVGAKCAACVGLVPLITFLRSSCGVLLQGAASYYR